MIIEGKDEIEVWKKSGENELANIKNTATFPRLSIEDEMYECETCKEVFLSIVEIAEHMEAEKHHTYKLLGTKYILNIG